jgi:hypothetical protein
VVLELSLDMINQVMLAQSAIGETADAYLVGEDRLLRSDPFSEKSSRTVFDSFADPEANRIESESVTREWSPAWHQLQGGGDGQRVYPGRGRRQALGVDQ